MTIDQTKADSRRSALHAPGYRPGLNRPRSEAPAPGRATVTWAGRSALKAALPIALLLLPAALAGCKTFSITKFVSPRAEGRVIDSQSHQPIRNVNVRRVIDDQSGRLLEAPKGGRQLQQAPAVRTAADGTFALASIRALTPFRKAGWNSVSLAFEHPGYKRFATNYTLANATNVLNGEPVVNTGDIRLQPLAKLQLR